MLNLAPSDFKIMQPELRNAIACSNEQPPIAPEESSLIPTHLSLYRGASQSEQI
ncbi:MAG TPA: hypothetical protein IGS40_19385 [Trichormus sp. M33_DOE_039]|nr:hypothetical protein [Trichormus sp. M33_DOE_039]